MTGTKLLDQLLRPGRTVRLADGTLVTCDDVDQRNWSRVGKGTTGSGKPVFLKQYVTAGGSWQPTLWASEQQGHDIAGRVLGDVARIPDVIGTSGDVLVSVFEFVPMRPIDELLRTERDRFARVFPGVTKAMADVLAVMAKVPGAELELPVSNVAYASARPALNFKGFDIRNVAMTQDGDMVLFDFGRPYVAPIEEAGAKLLVSIGMLNWGRPLRRFARGVDVALLEVAAAHLHPFLDRAAVSEEIDLQRRFRFREVHGSNTIERVAKKAGLALLGRRYLRELEEWCSANLG